MTRKAVCSDTQKNVLLRSRRRCCLCFWLDGVDKAQKGQIAHLNRDNTEAEEENLVFLCLAHHDEYDGKTSLSKGLREDEVRDWRNELYREMEYRFRTVKKRAFELRILGFLFTGEGDAVKARFRVANTGEASVRSPTITLRLPAGIKGNAPPMPQALPFGGSVSGFDPWAMRESREDIFERDGRVAIQELGGMNPVLMPGHSFTFEGLQLRLPEYEPEKELELEYRVDAEDMTPVLGKVSARLPTRPEELLSSEEYSDHASGPER
jgi:hypothetical protein